jgi:hypothetical protein
LDSKVKHKTIQEWDIIGSALGGLLGIAESILDRPDCKLRRRCARDGHVYQLTQVSLLKYVGGIGDDRGTNSRLGQAFKIEAGDGWIMKSNAKRDGCQDEVGRLDTVKRKHRAERVVIYGEGSRARAPGRSERCPYKASILHHQETQRQGRFAGIAGDQVEADAPLTILLDP